MSEAQTLSFSFQDGARAVALAREAVEAYVLNGQREHPGSMRDAFYNRTGAFVRLEAHGGRLRGCSGTHDTTQQLGHCIVDSAIEAASEGSCRSEVEAAELGSVTISVCIVSSSTRSEEPVEDIEIGSHGLVVSDGDTEGWMYPTVPLENDWSVYDYLDRTCRKAGLAPDAWEDDDVTVTLFEGEVYRERSPSGEIESL